MDKKYLQYNADQLLDDKAFVDWIVLGKNNREWQEFRDKHPEFSRTEAEARKMMLLLQDESDTLNEESVLRLWQNIQQFDEQHRKKVRTLEFRKIIRVAASLLILISLGILGYYSLNTFTEGYEFTAGLTETGDARIVLQNGEEIRMKEDNSIITVNDVNDQLVINDSVINLPVETEKPKKESPMNELVIPFGKRSEVLLADGTRVWLNSGSRLAFPSKFTGDQRTVFLEGEACFRVAHNSSQPFMVKTDDVNIEVLGTWFNVAAWPVEKLIETVLLEGSVALTRSKAFILNREEVILKPGQKADFQKEGKEFSVTEEKDAHTYIAWINGWLMYEQQSLASVLRELERYYDIKIILPEDYPADDKISGKLDLKESLEDVLIILADAGGFKFKIEKDRVIVEKSKSS